MFTGIIRHRGAVEQMTRSPSPRLVIRARGLRARRGDSVAVDGVCLTVAARSSGRLVFDLLGETLRATTLAYRKLGDRVNLEPSLRLGDQVGGHWVMGHVDGVGTVERVTRTSAGLTMVIRVPKLIRGYLAPQGGVWGEGAGGGAGPGGRRPGAGGGPNYDPRGKEADPALRGAEGGDCGRW